MRYNDWQLGSAAPAYRQGSQSASRRPIVDCGSNTERLRHPAKPCSQPSMKVRYARRQCATRFRIWRGPCKVRRNRLEIFSKDVKIYSIKI